MEEVIATALFLFGCESNACQWRGDALVLSKAESNLSATERRATRVTEHFTALGH
jgi:hypothetical protein